MNDRYSIEELIANDSFINYCNENNDKDILHWKEYLLLFPDEREKIVTAKSFVLGITIMLKQKEQTNALEKLKTAVAALQETNVEEAVPLVSKNTWFTKYLPYAAAAVIIGASIFFLSPGGNHRAIQATSSLAENNSAPTILYQTVNGEKKEILLPDSSRVILNAGSTMRLDDRFGQTSRKIYLEGEALFDVKHNKALPFSVHVKNFEVKVLGTLFNIKAYPGDKAEEASLIRGKVELLMKNGQGQSILLKPNQKAIVNNGIKSASQESSTALAPPKIIPVTFNAKDSSIIETSWVYNRLDIDNKKFVDLQSDLERLYNVKISFTDSTVGNYRFSATFENETIDQVLKALQLSYPFHYKIQNNQITISK